MSIINQANRSRWMDWQPKGQSSGAAQNELTKPSKPGFEGFEGAISGETPFIRGGAEPPKLAPCGSPHCGGCYEVAPGVRLHPPKVSQDWLDWLAKWQAQGVKLQ